MVFIISGVDIVIPQITKGIVDGGIANKIISIISLLIKLISVYIIIAVISALLEVILSYLYASMKNSVTIQITRSYIETIR
jgi:ATP-binding cassette subfamily B protein